MKRKNRVGSVIKSGRYLQNGGQLQGLAQEIFKKFDVDLEKIKAEVTVVNFEMIDYEEKNKLSVFGEKESISYILLFKIYNIEFRAKLLTFEYETKSELLKLDLTCETPDIYKEIKYCCNLLQRRRNLNLMFITLITFARYLESRRLVCDLLLRKTRNVKIEENKDGGKIVVYRDEKRNVRIGIFWSVECNSDHEVIDKVEIYFKLAELPKKGDIKNILTQLTEPNLQFNIKYHLWKNLLETLVDRSVFMVDNIPGLHAQKGSYMQIGEQATDASLDGISILRHPRKPDKVWVKKEEPQDDEGDDVTIVSSPSTSLHNETNPLVCIKNPNLLSKNSKEATILFSDSENSEKSINSSKTNSQSDHIIYIDSFDDRNITESSIREIPECSFHTITSSSAFEPEQDDALCSSSNVALKLPAPATNKPHEELTKTNIIELNDADTESVILLHSDTDEKEESEAGPSAKKNKYFSHMNHNCTNIINSSNSGEAGYPNIPLKNNFLNNNLNLSLQTKKPKIVDDDLEIIGITYVVPD